MEEDPVDFAGKRIDIRICYGDPLYPDLASHILYQDHVTPVCTPDYFHSIGNPAPDRLDETSLIHTSWGPSYASHPTWHDWFKAAGLVREPRAALGHRCAMSALAIDLALAGNGMALGQVSLMKSELETGQLICPYPERLPLGHPYCLVHPRTSSGKAGISQIRTILSR